MALLNQVPQGADVVTVIAGSPAEKAGIQVGDVIYKIDGTTLNDASGGMSKVVATKKPGDTISLDIWRNGASINIKVILSESPQ